MAMDPDHPSNVVVLLRRASPYLTFGVIALFAYGLFIAYPIVFAALVGTGLGVLANPVVDFLHGRLRLPRGISALLLGLALFGVLGGLLYLVGDIVSTEILPLINRLPELLEDVVERLGTLPLVGEELTRLTSGGGRSFGFGEFLSQNLGTAFRGIQSVGYVIALLVFMVAIAVYLVVNPRLYVRSALSALPAYLRPRSEEVMNETASSVRQWFFAQLVSMGTIGALTAMALWALGIENWLLIGFFTGVFEFVPYLGPIMAGFVAGIVTLGSEPEKLLWVLAVFVFIQQAEGNLITPVVMKKGVHLPPVHLLVIALIFGTWFGFVGVFLAAPVLVAARTIYLETYAKKMNEMHRPPVTGGPVELLERMEKPARVQAPSIDAGSRATEGAGKIKRKRRRESA